MRDLILFGLIKGINVQEFISQAYRRGIDVINDPILSGIINCLQASNYQYVKKKGRFCLPNSANLIGVVDDSGELAANEVFIQIKRNEFARIDRKIDPEISQVI